MFTTGDFNNMINAVKIEYRNIGRIRDDLMREGVVSVSAGDALYDRQQELSKLIEKLQKAAGIIPA